MAEWLVERGIGEDRAILLDGGTIVEARILPEGELVAGTVIAARLVKRIAARNEGVAAWDGGEAIVAPLPIGVTEGAPTLIEITRPPLPEPGKPKRARGRPARGGAAPGAPSPLDDRTDATVASPVGLDAFEAGGWTALLEEAATGVVRFPGGQLTIHPTPAMTLVDIDGDGAPATLALAGAEAAARAIRRLDLGGSIGIDLPGGDDKALRQAVAARIDAVLPQPFERTAMNGFGFVQIVRRRARRSLMELYAAEPALAHARALLRTAERAPGAGERTLVAAPPVIAALAARPDWIDALAKRLGTAVVLQGDPARAISAGHVHARYP